MTKARQTDRDLVLQTDEVRDGRGGWTDRHEVAKQGRTVRHTLHVADRADLFVTHHTSHVQARQIAQTGQGTSHVARRPGQTWGRRREGAGSWRR